MSRSNHSYYQTFRHADEQRPIQSAFSTRRGVVYRRRSHWFKKYWYPGPPHWWKQMWHQKARAVQKAEMLANPNDPLVTPMRRIVDLWDWY
jgi:hypothetical protein